MSNLLRAAALLALAAAPAAALGWWLGAGQGWLAVLLPALAAAAAAYLALTPLLLRGYRAREVGDHDAPHLLAMVRELAARAGLPAPRVCLLDEPAANAFVVGRDARHASLVLTTGILRLLDERELRAVLAHEFAHMLRGDMLPASLAAALGGLLAAASQVGCGVVDESTSSRGRLVSASPLWLLLAPLAGAMAWLGASARHEFAADRLGASLCGDAPALARALQRVQADAAEQPGWPVAGCNPAGGQMMVCDPLADSPTDPLADSPTDSLTDSLTASSARTPGGRGGLQRLFRCHPPIQQRVHALLAHGHGGGTGSAPVFEKPLEGGVDQHPGDAVQQ